MFHGQDRELQATHPTDLSGPEAASVDEVLTGDGPGVAAVDVPQAVPAPLDRLGPGVPLDLGPGQTGGLGVGMGDPGRIDVALERVVHGSDEVLLVEVGHQLLGLGHRDHLGVDPEVAAAGVGVAEPVHALLGIGQLDTAGQVDAAVPTADPLDLLVELDGVLLEGGHVRVAVEGVHSPGGVPGRPGGQLLALDQDHIGPTVLGQVVQHAGADHPSADDDGSGLTFHLSSRSLGSGFGCGDLSTAGGWGFGRPPLASSAPGRSPGGTPALGFGSALT